MNEVDSVEFSSSEVRRGNKIVKNVSASNAAKELLKNGILVETSKGLICMSLKDALSKGVGGHNLSVEDFQTVATELLFQEGPDCVNVQKSVSLWTENAIKPKKLYSQVKKSHNNNNNNINNNNKNDNDNVNGNKMKKGKFSLNYSVTDSFNSTQEDIEEHKDIHETFLGLPSFEYSFLEKVGEESDESNFDNMKKQLAHFEQNISEQNEIINKKALLNKRSLILSNNVDKPVIAVQKIVKKLANKNDSISQVKFKTTSLSSMLISPNLLPKSSQSLHESYVSCGETSDNSEITSLVTDEAETKPVKKRGGWPKGRKRKPEMKNEIRPPKAPATGYVIFLNEKRKDYRDMPFTEVTKLLGSEWSRLSLQEKKRYLDQAEIEKKRYREELKIYRQSDAYQTYLHKKRLKRLQGNGTEESDMDATDEIDEEDSEELYCRSCDQWFHSLHNKKEHLYGRQHLQSLAGRFTKMSDRDWCNPNMSSTSLDESSLDGSSYLKGNKEHCCGKNKESLNMDDAIVKFMSINKEREEERIILRKKLEESKSKNQALSLDLQKLNETLDSLSGMIESERTTQILLEQRLFNLLNVPTLFYLPEALIGENH